MRNILFKKSKGVTLVELIVAIAIFTIVIGGAYSIFGFGNTTYYNGVKQYDLQSSIRLANDYITQQLRYAMSIEIKNSGFTVPAQSTLEPYQNYLYVDGTSIVHLNKYFTKTFQVGNGGKIDFTSIEPYKDLSFNIEAVSGRQKYNINGDVYPLNLHLDKGFIEGTASGLPGKKSGTIIYFKTATDFIAERLRPIASIGAFNSKTKLSINYDRDIIGAEILSSDGVSSPNISYSGRTVTITATNTNDGGKISIRVTFGGLETYGNTYDYNVVYDATTTKWSIE